MNDWTMLALGLALTIGTAFFVASEFSLLNLERSDLEARAERGEKGLGRTIAGAPPWRADHHSRAERRTWAREPAVRQTCKVGSQWL